jgi:hypothetical protein
MESHTRFQILIDQHQLPIGQTRLRLLHCELVDIVAQLRLMPWLHGEGSFRLLPLVTMKILAGSSYFLHSTSWSLTAGLQSGHEVTRKYDVGGSEL